MGNVQQNRSAGAVAPGSLILLNGRGALVRQCRSPGKIKEDLNCKRFLNFNQLKL